MTIKCWRTKKCLAIDTYKVNKILVMEGDAEEDRKMIEMGAEPYLNFEREDGSWLSVPVEFVINITD